MKYELYYSTGGHGGPYKNKKEGISAAHRLIAGLKGSCSIEIRPRNSKALGGYGQNKGSWYVKKSVLN